MVGVIQIRQGEQAEADSRRGDCPKQSKANKRQ